MRIRKFLFSLFVLIVLTAKSQSPSPYVVPNVDWKNYFSQRSSVGSAPCALDANSNVYSTGYTGLTASADLVVFKYDSLGVLQYSLSINNGGYDCGNSIRVDGAGNAYVAGTTYNAATGLDYIVLKINPSGTTLWTQIFDRGFGNDDDAADLCIDKLTGDVFVTGKCNNAGSTETDIITLKLDGNTGTLNWQHVFAGSSGLNDNGVSTILSSDGLIVYVTGNTEVAGNGLDIVTFAVNAASGTPYWGPMIDGGSSNNDDRSNGIILSGANVVVIGEIDNGGAGLDYYINKYNGLTGSSVWQKNYNYGGTVDRATSVCRDSTGNIGVVGTVYNGSMYQYHTVLYDSTGNQYSVNIENTGLSTLTADPRICNDTIAAHWYVSGEIQKATRDIFVYQVTPSGNTSWRQAIDGQNSNFDCATAIAVNGVGVVYVGGQSKNSTANYDYTTIKINQTPVYFPPDQFATSQEKPNPSHLYYENKGQILWKDSLTVANEILFATTDNYPLTYYKANRISHKYVKLDTSGVGNDTIQRIDINMLNANSLASAYPFSPNHGKVSFMQEGLPNAVIGVQGYERYFIPNIYPSIDLHYYSNENGIKMYYVLKPGANPKNIVWEISGSTFNGIVGTGLEIKGFNGKVKFDQPVVYTVNMSGSPVSVTTTVNWNNPATNKYDLNISSYNTAWPLIIELDYGNTVTTPSSLDNVSNSTYYGGWWDEGFKDIDVDQSTGNYVTVGVAASSLDTHIFPVISGSLVSVTSFTNGGTHLISMVIFDKNGVRKAVNTYGLIGKWMRPLAGTLSGNYVTVVGNCITNFTYGNLPVINNAGVLTPGTFSNNFGEGYVVQFEYNPAASSINSMKWVSRLNGFASDITKTPDNKHLYIVSATNYIFLPVTTQSLAGAYNNNVAASNYHYQISKFDSLGITKWSAIFPAPNRAYQRTTIFNSLNNNSNTSLEEDNYIKCKITCDNYGFYLAGEVDTTGLYIKNTYNSLGVDSTFNGKTDAFFARFNKKDNLIVSSYLGGKEHDAFTAVSVANNKEAVMVGYSNSKNNLKITTLPTGLNYIDSTITFGNSKILISKFDTIGNKNWTTYYGNDNGPDIVGWGVVSDMAGRVFVTGKDLGSVTYAITNPTGVYTNQTVLNTESYMVGFSTINDYPIWNTSFGGKREDIGLGLAYNSKNGNVVLTGITNTSYSITNESPFFPITLDPLVPGIWFQKWLNSSVNDLQTAYDGYISTFNSAVVVGLKEYYEDKNNTDYFNLFPNPANNECNIAFKKGINGNVKIEVYNQMGQLILSEVRINIVDHSLLNINTSRLITGMYIVKITGNDNSFSKKLIISK